MAGEKLLLREEEEDGLRFTPYT